MVEGEGTLPWENVQERAAPLKLSECVATPVTHPYHRQLFLLISVKLFKWITLQSATPPRGLTSTIVTIIDFPRMKKKYSRDKLYTGGVLYF